jgi:thiol:disulfide interchange protein DsbD
MNINSRFKVQGSKFKIQGYPYVCLLFSAFISLFVLLFPPQSAFSQPLKPEQAFSFQARLLKSDLIEIRLQIAPGHYIYRDKFKFALEPTQIKLGTPQFPAGQFKEDAYFGRQEIFRGDSVIQIPVTPVPSLEGPILLSLTYQGCSDAGLCYPPKTQKIPLTFLPAASQENRVAPPPPQGEEKGSESSTIARLFGNSSYPWIILSFFGFGLLLSLTPCVFPMIPILSCIIVAQGKNLTKWRAFALSATYVMGMAMTYSAVGVIAGLSGRLLTAALQNPYVLGAFALIFVALAFCMFGFYDLQVPSSIQSKMTSASNKFKAGTFLGILLMGMFSAVIVGPCVSAPLAGALIYISHTNNVWLGGTALMALSLGMGIPLLILGTSAGVLLPKAGLWMNAVKSFFGVVLLAVALWTISPLLSITIQMFLWGAFLIISAVYLQALDPLPPGSRGWARFRKGLGFIALILGSSFLIGALMGGQDLLQPLSELGRRTGGTSDPKAMTAQSSGLPFQRLTSLGQLEATLKENQGQRVMLFVTADWCVSCKELKEFTFKDPQVQDRLLKGWKLIQADVTQTNQETGALLKQFNLFGPPAVLFFDKGGKEIAEARVIGYQKAGDFLKTLDRAFENR